MNFLYFLTICILLITCINYVQHKFNFLLDLNLKHKIKNVKKIPLSGGIYILLCLMICKYAFDTNISLNLLLILFLFLVLGFFSDTKPNFAPVLRLALQLLVIFLLIYLTDLEINKSNIFFIDNYLSYNYFNLIFTSLCIIVLLNGANFIDGVNTNLTGYYIIVIFFISKFNYNFDLIYLLIILIAFYFYNFFGKCFLGDNGVYVISILISFIIIGIINNNDINPFFAVNLLWYPAFENLFSIIRRYVSNDKVDRADKKHLHSILYLILKTKFTKYSNSFCGLLLNSYNLISTYLSFKYIFNSQILITILIINIIFYLLTYFKLLNILSKRLVSKK